MALNMLRSTLSWLIFEREVGDAGKTPEFYLRRTDECLKRAEELTTVGTGPRCNQNQCRCLVDKLRIALKSGVKVMYTWGSTCASPVDMARSLEIFGLLFALSKEVEGFIQGCCNDGWIFQSAMRFNNVSERISSLSFSLEMFIIVFGGTPSLALSESDSVSGEAETFAGLDEQSLSQPSGAEWQLATLLLKCSERERQLRLARNLHGFNQPRSPEILGRDVELAAQILGKGAQLKTPGHSLRTTIEAWWSSEPSKRPQYFSDICADLTWLLKPALFMKSTWSKSPRCFSMDEIRRMTNSFGNLNRLSWGALTMVYKGVVRDTGEEVAVKRILENSRCNDEFKTQIGLLSSLHHVNLVRFVGFCCGDDETSLVFEYMANGTLDKYLHVHERKGSLTWPVRRNICLGVASVVHYLHSLGQPRIAHCHVRSSNVSLDQNLNPKVNLQLALWAPVIKSELQSPRHSVSSLGTCPSCRDCLAPDFGTREKGSETVDIHNLGVLLLEIVSGRRSIDPKLPKRQLHLKQWARKLQLEGRSHKLIDSTLNLEPVEESEAVRIIQIALLCVYRAQDTRPEMVGEVLNPAQLGLGRSGALGVERERHAGSCGSSSGDLPGSSIPDLNDFGDGEAGLVVGGFEEGESSEVSFEGRVYRGVNMERDALIGLTHLCSGVKLRVIEGFYLLINCASSQGGPLAVINTKYMPASPASPDSSPASPIVKKAIELAKTRDSQYSKLAVKLMAKLTTDAGGEPDSVIVKEVAHALDFLIPLMRGKRLSKTRLLAAESVANILVNRKLRMTLWDYDGIVPAFVAFSNVKGAGSQERAQNVCLKGLKHLANSDMSCEMTGDTTQTIVAALIKLLRRGLSFEPELTSLVKDSLVELENQVQAIEDATPTHRVCELVWEDMSKLMVNESPLDYHTTVLGRMSIVRLMRKLCAVYKDDVINIDHCFRFMLKMIKRVVSEITNSEQLLIPPEQRRELRTLLASAVELLCFCGKDTAQSVLHRDAQGLKTLEDLFVNGEGQGIPDGCRLQILFFLNQVNPHGTVFPGGMEFLVATSQSEDEISRQQVANALRMLVAKKKNLTELKDAGGIAILMALLQDPSRSCQRDALVAVHGLPPSVVTSVAGQLPLQNILTFLDEEWPSTERTAAVGLLSVMVKEKAVSADVLVKRNGALKAILNLMESGLDSQKSACALFFEMAKGDPNVRRRIAEPGLRALNILVKYVGDHVRDHTDSDPMADEFKELLTATLVLFCGRGQGCQEAVMRADGQVFLVASLQERNLRANAAQGLLELIRDPTTRETVLEAGFLTTAMGCIDAQFACTDIALSVRIISSTPEGLARIDSSPRGIETLLNLLDHCPDPPGQGAAALVIARLYPNLPEERQTRITERAELFFRYLNPLDVSHCMDFLEALAAIACKEQGRKMIHQSRGHEPLIDNLKSVTQPDIQHLMLKILAELSSDAKGEAETRCANNIRGAFMERKIYINLFNLIRSNEFIGETENVKCALLLIRNLSLAESKYVCETLVEQGVVTLLLEVLRQQEVGVSGVTLLAVKALEKFLGINSKGSQAFLKFGGIKPLTAILKLAAFGADSRDAKLFSISVLTQVAQHPQTREPACQAIFKSDILGALNQVISHCDIDKIRFKAAVLMHLLAAYGPTGDVCSDMEAKGCLDALIQLREREDCREVLHVAKAVLKYVSDNSRRCKRYIDSHTAGSLDPLKPTTEAYEM